VRAAAILSVGRLDNRAAGGGVPFDICSALPLLRTSHLQSVRRNVNTNTGLISVRKAMDSFLGNHTKKDCQEHCKTPQ